MLTALDKEAIELASQELRSGELIEYIQNIYASKIFRATTKFNSQGEEAVMPNEIADHVDGYIGIRPLTQATVRKAQAVSTNLGFGLFGERLQLK